MTLSPCGKDCSSCKALAQNIIFEDEREQLSALLQKYMDIDIKPEKLYCDGCKSWILDAQRLIESCGIKACLKAKKKRHCGKCPEYPCELFNKYAGISIYGAMKKLGDSFNETEYREFIAPYDNKTAMDAFKSCGRFSRRKG